ncbi:unnamed protein product [Brassica rapa subsp. narinosa]
MTEPSRSGRAEEVNEHQVSEEVIKVADKKESEFKNAFTTTYLGVYVKISIIICNRLVLYPVC